MHVVRLDRPWEDTDFLMQGFVIHDQSDIDALCRQCEVVYIEAKIETLAQHGKPSAPPKKIERRQEPKGLFSRFKRSKKEEPEPEQKKPGVKPVPTGIPDPNKRVTYINKISTEKELEVAQNTYSSAKQVVKNIMDGIRIGRTIDMEDAREAVSQVVDSVLRNKDALAWLSKIKNKDEYTAEHSLNVCILSATFARHLGHDEIEIQHVALCGLLHDVGKSKIPDEILNKEGRFTDEEFDIMRQHTTFGRDLLLALPKTDHVAIDVAHSHHERLDGSGYPRGLNASQIPYYAKLVSLVDCYDAITSSRCYDGARSSIEALDIIYKNQGVQFDKELALEFIKCIGIYPAGALVEFSNGEVGIVLSVDPESKLRPRVLLVRDSDKNPRKERIIDMKKIDLDSAGKPYTIVSELPNLSYGVDLREYLKKGLVVGDAQDAKVPMLEEQIKK